MYKYQVQNTAEFSFISTTREHTGTYRCYYWMSEPWETWEKSDPVELVVTDYHLAAPSISLCLDRCVEMGTNVTFCVETRTNVTILCRGKNDGSSLLLHKDGSSAPIQHQDPDGGSVATFTLFGVTLEDAGTYRCSYRSKNYPFVSSPLGNSVVLKVTPTPTPPGALAGPRWNLVVAVVGGCIAAIIFILVLFFLVAAHRRWIWRDGNPQGTTPRRPETVQFQVPPADTEGLTYVELQVATPSTQPPSSPSSPQPSVIYAEVATARPC
ncbi:leukocyte immunoglobulin-like receptor subfamily B member 3 [Numida meleagris]|uniref:leukocyte immunoglobulin-like receptor subfamily B member 3 n=1 Tax=Numida meleagris TaxID=8996 RepID=UPI000B3DF4C2|nr:leukocyte immunoglobulin-like receptor subfamily B member 3 [Numida meleagris]